MMVKGKGEVLASDVEIGDRMWVMDVNDLRKSIGVVYEKLLDSRHYATRLLLTQSSTIVVNSVVASTKESTGSILLEKALKFANFIGGTFGLSVVRQLSYIWGGLLTHGDAVSVEDA